MYPFQCIYSNQILLPPVYIVSLNKSGDLIFSQEKIKTEEERGKNGRSNIRTWKVRFPQVFHKQFYIIHICTDVYWHTQTHKKNTEKGRLITPEDDKTHDITQSHVLTITDNNQQGHDPQ